MSFVYIACGTTVDKVGSGAEVGSVIQAITEVRGLFAGQSELESLTTARDRCNALSAFFTGVAEIDGEIDHLARREAVPMIEARLAGLLSEHRTSICPSQEAILRQRSTALVGRVAKLELDASRWLHECNCRLASGGGVAGLFGELQHPPPFLTEKGETDLRGLVAVVQQKLDADASGQVLRLFSQIGSKDEQRRVLVELQRIVEGN